MLIESSFTCLSFWVLLDNGLIFNRVVLVLAIILIIEVSQLLGWRRSHFVYFWINFYPEHSLATHIIKTFLRIIARIFLHSSFTSIKTALSVTCRFWSGSLQYRTKNSSHSTTWVTHFPLSAQRPSASPGAVVWGCLALFFSECYTFICTKQWLVFPWICDLIVANGWMHIPSFHLYCNEENYDRVKRLFAFEFHFGCLKLLFI